jgi:hypothetical protein
MSYTLGSITLPNPASFLRQQIEIGGTIITIDGTTKKDIVTRKEKYVLEYKMLTQTQVASILGELNDMATKDFTVDETNLAISATPVHVEISDRQYNTGGGEYREDITLVLTEVA